MKVRNVMNVISSNLIFKEPFKEMYAFPFSASFGDISLKWFLEY